MLGRDMSGGRFAIFLTIVLSVWALMHLYVFWRMASVPWIAARCSRCTLWVLAILLWSGYPLARILNAWGLETLAWPLEFAAANWIGVLFLLLAMLLCVE